MNILKTFLLIVVSLSCIAVSKGSPLTSYQINREGSSSADSMYHSASFEKAVSAYQNADFDKAITLFTEIADDELENRIVRRDALHFLGRSYLAMRNNEDAREALELMAEFEPPRVEMDPDVESPPLLRLYYDVYKKRERQYTVADEGQKFTIAVIDFSNQSIDDHERLEPLSKGFSSLFINQLNGATELKVVERERLQWLLNELDLQKNTARVDQNTAVRTGKLLGAHLVLMGSYMRLGKQMVLNARLVSVETGEILITDQVQGKADKFYDLAETLSLNMAKSINVDLEENKLGSRFKDTRSLDALLSYSEGLDFLESDNYRAAYEKFLEALEYDPSYKRAFLKARSLEPFVSTG